MNQNILKEDIRQFADLFPLWTQLRGKTFLITGATGLIGSVMIRCLLELNRKYRLDIRVVAVVRNVEKAKQIYDGEFYSIECLQMQLSDIKPENIGGHIDFVVHLASPTIGTYMESHPVETFNFAYQSTYNLLTFANEAKVESMVYISSLEYYGQILDDHIVSEDMQGYLNPNSVRSSYSMGKRAAEFLCFAFAKEYSTPAKVARLTQTFGAGISENENRVFAQFARSVITDEDIVLHTTGESAKPYCYTTDCVSAILFILLCGKDGEVYNVANEETYITIKEMAEIVKKYFNPSINVRIIQNDNMGYAPVTKLNLSTDKLRSLGWQPKVGLREMYERLINYLHN